MADIARKVGLGRSTVSMALRNHPEIATATRDRVLKAASELGYQPNPLIALLMSRLHEETATRRDTVLAVINEPEADWNWRDFPIFQTMWAGIEAQAKRRGYLVEEFRVGPNGMSPERLNQILVTRGIPGLILAPKFGTTPSRFTRWENFAAVTADLSVKTPGLSRTCIDHFHNFNRAWAELEARGYRRIGFLNNPGLSIRCDHQYHAANLVKLDLLPPERRVAPLILPGEETTADNVRTWLRKERPDAVLLASADYMLRIVREVAAVPEELGVAALELGCAPADMSGIDERMHDIGEAAVDMLIGRLQRNERGPVSAPRTLHVEGVWRDGNTTRRLN
ncbi:MAG: LacI family DNA-binding transcriptional regulator [Verrucomicrobia bacterium]|nr:LacI family DNA-binding transcriptional regulator [Verrucomicrobiota bacterium]